MKNDLTCAVVRDLLPAYTEGLTEQETNEAVEMWPEWVEAIEHFEGKKLR